MTISTDSPLVGPPSGELVAALDFAGTDAAEYVREVWRLGQLVGLDPALLVAQSAHETADWTSFWWETRRNPAGIGITGDPAQDAASQTWESQTDAARGHVVHMLAYVNGDTGDVPPIELYGGNPPASYDVRLRHVLDQPWVGTIRTIRDLTGRWATDPDYDTKVVAKHRAVFGAGLSEGMPCLAGGLAVNQEGS